MNWKFWKRASVPPVKRSFARSKVRGFEAASTSRHTSTPKTSPPINQLFSRYHRILKAQARDLTLNNPIAARAKEIYPAYVGPIRPYLKNPDGSERNKKIAGLLERFFESSQLDVAGSLNLQAMQAAEVGALVQDGEVLVERLWVKDWKEKGLDLPIQFRLLEGDSIASHKGKLGVQLDKYSSPCGFWMADEEGAARYQQKKDIIHAFKPIRPGQLRGLTRFAPVILRLRDVDQYQDAAIIMAKMASMYVGSWEDLSSGYELGAQYTESEIAEMMESAMEKLESGSILPPIPRKRLVFNTPPPGGRFREDSQEFIRAIATGLSVPSVLLTNDYSEANRASMRVCFSDFERSVRQEQNLWISQIGQRKIEWFLEACQSVGIKTEGVEIGWVLPRKIQVEPDKEMNSLMMEIAAGLKSPWEAMREQGREPEAVLSEIKKAKDAFKKYGFSPTMIGQQLSIYNEENEEKK